MHLVRGHNFAPCNTTERLVQTLLTRPCALHPWPRVLGCWSVAKWGSEWRSGRVVGGWRWRPVFRPPTRRPLMCQRVRAPASRQREQSDLDIVAERKRRSSLLFCKISGLLLFLRTRLKTPPPEKNPHKTKTFN